MQARYLLIIFWGYTTCHPMGLSSLLPTQNTIYEVLVNYILGDDAHTEPEWAPLRAAADSLDHERVAALLAQGELLTQRDEKRRTLFHRICRRANAGPTLRALIVSPRKSVIDVVSLMNIKPERYFDRLVNLHLWGVLRVLIRTDDVDLTAQERAHYKLRGLLPTDYFRLCYKYRPEVYAAYQAYFDQQVTEDLYG